MKEEDLGHGISITGFDSAEEMFEYMETREAEVAEEMKNLLEPQKGIGYGSYVLRVVGYDEESLAIFGYIYTEEEVLDLEIQAGAEVETGELDHIMDGLRDAYERGYRNGYWYSVVLPDGEPGDAHLLSLWPITEADYQHALDNGWEMPAYLHERVKSELDEHKEE